MLVLLNYNGYLETVIFSNRIMYRFFKFNIKISRLNMFTYVRISKCNILFYFKTLISNTYLYVIRNAVLPCCPSVGLGQRMPAKKSFNTERRPNVTFLKKTF